MLLRAISVICLFSFAGFASATPNCGGISSSHADERACWQKAAEESSALVRAAQDDLRKRIESWDEDADYRERTLVLFNESTQQFDRYRKAQCEFEASSAAGGNGAGDMRLSCQISLDEVYLRSVRVQSAWFQKR